MLISFREQIFWIGRLPYGAAAGIPAKPAHVSPLLAIAEPAELELGGNAGYLDSEAPGRR
jgi:hypothetical protein